MRLTCEHCRFWDNSVALCGKSDITGACRRKAPRINKVTGGAMWPFTEDSDWCGEFVVLCHPNGEPKWMPDGRALNELGNVIPEPEAYR